VGFIGDFAKAVLITWVFFWVLAMVYFFATEQLALGALFFVGLLIPSSFIAYEYWKYRKKQ
jgi:hypothetical protein